MKNRWMRGFALVLCAVLLVWNAGTVAYAWNSGKEKIKEEAETPLFTEKTQAELTKDETVYVLAGADGSVQNIIVSNWLKNSAGSMSVLDVSDLKNVENVKGEETYRMDGEHTLIWDAQGNDIYYQGNTEKELPVSLLVSYQLDGKSISAKELAGKSGRVTIRFDYKNNQRETVSVDGKQETMFVPFVMLTGMLLDNDVFTNVEVSNGKLVNDGDRTAVFGIAFPGLQSNLGIEAEKLEIPDSMEITADVKNFALGNTLTIASNEVFSHFGTEKLDSFGNLTESMDALTGAVTQLTDGSAQLYDGLCTLLEKSGELVAGIDALAAGGKKLKEGAETLDAGMLSLSDGAKELAAGLGQLTASSSTLMEGATQVFEALLQTADAQLAAVGLPVPPLTMDNYAQVLDGVLASLSAGSGSLPEGEAAQAAQAQAAAGIQALKGQLDAYHTFYIGLTQYTTGVASAKAGADALSEGSAGLKQGSAGLYEGAGELYDGIVTLKGGAPALTEGVTTLRDGAKRLSDGIKEFNEEGIQKLVDAVDGDISSLMARIKASVDASKTYESFSGRSDEMDGQVKFIYRTEAVKEER